jgi:hypothetical protein
MMNFKDQMIIWDTDTIPIKDRVTCTLSSVEDLIEVYKSANEPQMLRNEYSRSTKILDVEVDMIRSMEGFTFTTVLDLNICYFLIKMNADA